MISTSASSPSMGRKRCRQGARRKGGAAHEAVRRTVLVCCCYVVAVAGGRFAAAFTAVPPLAPLPSSAHGDRAHVHALKSEPSRRGGVFTSAAEAGAGAGAGTGASVRQRGSREGFDSSGGRGRIKRTLVVGSSRTEPPASSRPRSSLSSTRSPAVPDTTTAVDAEFSDRRPAGSSVPPTSTAGESQARGSKRSGDGGGKGKLPLPFFDVESVGLTGRWEEMGGNFLLRPPNDQAPKALLHFLGGAFVGAAPHLTYNYLLNGLAEMGFLVVATPYPLGFDYLDVCDGILDRFERAAVPLAAQYGALPVVGIGHSCGALLQLLITCLFPDTPRAANALISFNNKPVSDAVPGFEELILPLVMQVLKEGGGKSTLFSTLEMLRETVDNLVDGVAESQFAPAVLENELVPLVRQVLQITDQLPALFQSIADGTREFTPTPDETRDVVSKMYRARRTIMIRFENDSIDESEGMKDVIQEGKTLLRMRRPLVDMELRYEIIKGNHVTPLTQNVFLDTPVDAIDPLLGVRKGMKKEFLKTVNHLGQILVDWLEESAPPIPPPNVEAGSGGGAGVAGAGGFPAAAASAGGVNGPV